MLYDNQNLEPIVATGRGGSGTRLLSTLLQDMKVFLGNDLNEMQDSLEWVDLIYEIVLDGLPNRPSTYGDKWRSQFQYLAKEVLANSGFLNSGLWGWKLPETSLCLPEVFAAFPKAKLIHLIRHPVTSSLRRTHLTSRIDNPIGAAVIKAAYEHLGWNEDTIGVREDYQNNAVTWLYQVNAIATYADEFLNTKQYLVLRYEDLCSDPVHGFNLINEFLGDGNSNAVKLQTDEKRIKGIDINDPRALEVWGICGSIGSRYGYSVDGIV